mgnify:CR=1 FL=1
MHSGPGDATLIGAVQDVSGTSVSVTLRADRFSGLSFVDGQGYRIGQIGSFVKIPVGYVDLFGIVSQVGASAVPENLAKAMPNGQRWMTVQLIGEGYRAGRFQRGISQYPKLASLPLVLWFWASTASTRVPLGIEQQFTRSIPTRTVRPRADYAFRSGR